MSGLSFGERVPVLNQIVDGTIREGEDRCPECGRGFPVRDTDRIAAMRVLGKYGGLDMAKGVSLDEVRDLVEALATATERVMDKLEAGHIGFDEAWTDLVDLWKQCTEPYSVS